MERRPGIAQTYRCSVAAITHIYDERLLTRAEANGHPFDYIEVHYRRKRLLSKIGLYAPLKLLN